MIVFARESSLSVHLRAWTPTPLEPHCQTSSLSLGPLRGRHRAWHRLARGDHDPYGCSGGCLEYLLDRPL